MTDPRSQYVIKALAVDFAPKFRKPIATRCQRLEENLLLNARKIREDQGALHKLRKAKEAKGPQKCPPCNPDIFERNRPRCKKELSTGVCPTAHAHAHGTFRVRGLGSCAADKGSMGSRLRALQRNAISNQTMLDSHRAFLNSRQQGDPDPHPTLAMEMDTDGFVDVPEDTAVNVTPHPLETTVAMTWSSHRLARPSSAPSLTSQRKLQRPISACSLSSAGIKEVPDDWNAQMSSRIPSGVPSRNTSRPSSANSISGRFAAIESNMRKNQELLQTNREGIGAVHQIRKEKADKVREAMLRELAQLQKSDSFLDNL